MKPMTINGVGCRQCGGRFSTVSEFEEHDCDSGGNAGGSFSGP